jgi:Tfp pilus assembly protein PilX
MKSARVHSRGFTLIASLLMLLLLTGIAIGLLMMVNTEGKVGATDVQKNVAYHAAEGGIEKMTNDLATTFNNAQSPTADEIYALSNHPPSIPGIIWPPGGYTVMLANGQTTGKLTEKCTANTTLNSPNPCWAQVQSGPNTGLWAQIIPINMVATAQTLGGQEVSLMRSAQVALIPVFQFGVFCEGDCGFFNSPTLDFNGRVHTNGDLYLGVSSGSTLTFHDKLEAYGNIITNNLPNTLSASSYGDTGPVYIPTKDGNCPTPGSAVTGNCVVLPAADGSVSGNGGDPPQSSYNTAFNTFSGTVNHELINDNYGSTASGQVGTGAKLLSMPFVTGTVHPYELIRRPTSLDTTALSQSRESNLAQIRILLSDDPSDFVGNGVSTSTSPAYLDPNNVRLANVNQPGATAQSVVSQYGVNLTLASGNVGPTFTAASSYNLYFATASNGVLPACNSSATCTTDWPYPPARWLAAMAPTGVSPPNPMLYANPGNSPPAPYFNAASIPTITSGSITNPLPSTFILCPTKAALGVTSISGLNANCPATASLAAPYYYLSSGAQLSATPTNATTDATTLQTASWNLIDGWLRVEYVDPSGNWHPVTNQWLALGFARDVKPPTSTTPNPINPNAILLLQQPADRASPSAGTLSASYTSMGTTTWSYTCTSTSHNPCTAWSIVPPTSLIDPSGGNYWEFGPSSPSAQSLTQYNWYPINFYDAREGEPRDVTTNQSNDTCTTNGVMNAVEIDVGNLQNWLAANYTANSAAGTYVDYVQQNGYVLYFSDRRGMLRNTLPPMEMGSSSVSPAKTGDSGLENVISSGSSAGTPDGTLEPPMTGLAVDGVALDSPEDVNLNNQLDNFGGWNLGLGFYGTVGSSTKNLNAQITSTTNPDPYGTASNARIATCGTTGRKNWVSGARHVLKLVDGALGNLPLSPNNGGFTVASENPVYIQGDYNSNSTDTFFLDETSGKPGPDMTSSSGTPLHSPAAVIADTVTILSNNWDDRYSTMGNSALCNNPSPTDPSCAPNNNTANGNRPGTTTWYRVAVAAGKTIRFPFPSWASSSDYPIGTDGGIHNFLHFLEDWQNTNATLHYGGSLVSLYFSTYNTGIFKCCEYSVYQPPTRDYIFDTDFTTPTGLPPGTPLFKDVETLGYRQLFTTRTQ